MAKSIQTKLLCQGLMWLGLLQLCGCTLEPGTVFTGDDSEAGSGMEAPSTTADLTSSTAAMTTSNTAEPDSMMETNSDTVVSTTSTTDPTTTDADAITDSETESVGLYIPLPFCGDGKKNSPLEECDNPGHSGCTSDCKLAMRVFVTKNKYKGKLHSLELVDLKAKVEDALAENQDPGNLLLEKIDKICNSELPTNLNTNGLGKPAVYKAFIYHTPILFTQILGYNEYNLTPQAPSNRFSTGHNTPYVNECNGNIASIATSWGALVNNTMNNNAIQCDEDGTPIPLDLDNEPCAWTNVNYNGHEWTEGVDCNKWTGETQDATGRTGLVGSNTYTWFKGPNPETCNNECHLYCVEQYPTKDPNG